MYLWDSSSWKGAQEVSGPPSHAQQSQLWDQTWLLGALFSQVLKTSRDGHYTASLGSLSHSWAVLIVSKFSLISSLNVSCFNSYPLSLIPFPCLSVHCCEQPPWRHEDAALRCPWSQPCSRLKQPWPSSLSSQGKCSSLPSILGTLSWRAINTIFLSLLWQQFADFDCCHNLNNFPSNLWKEETVKIPYETSHFYTKWLLFQLLVGIPLKKLLL